MPARCVIAATANSTNTGLAEWIRIGMQSILSRKAGLNEQRDYCGGYPVELRMLHTERFGRLLY